MIVVVFSLHDDVLLVVLVPSTVTDGMVAYGGVDTRYIEAIAKDTVYTLYNVAPGGTDYAEQVIARVATAASRQPILQDDGKFPFYPHLLAQSSKYFWA